MFGTDKGGGQPRRNYVPASTDEKRELMLGSTMINMVLSVCVGVLCVAIWLLLGYPFLSWKPLAVFGFSFLAAYLFGLVVRVKP